MGLSNRVVAVGLISLGLLISGGYVWYQAKTPTTSQPSSTFGGSVPLATDIDSVDLVPVPGQSGNGIASRQFLDGIFVHGITAELPDPPVGQFYGGWLVMNGDTAHALFTGTLVKQGASYSLDFSSPTDQRSYTEVRITLQTAQNQPMQATVVSGTFSTN